MIGDSPISDNKLSLMVNALSRIVFDVSQAGPGKSHILSFPVRPLQSSNSATLTYFDIGVCAGEFVGTCEGPHGTTVPVHIEHLDADTVQCMLTPRAAGPHTLSLLFGGFPLPSSPFHGLAESGGTGVRVVLTGKGLASAMCGQVAEFTIDGSQAGAGVPAVTLSGVKHDIDVSLKTVGTNVYKATYVPTKPGAYLLNVMWSDR